ncbi:hypothetical protein ACN5ZK_09505 [Macrococcoides bohemicum]|uniref:hypothetical protein n=1 Tax=Macrococcoides bohemicum TaxID=1903056 RepID=UPI003AFFD304
MKLLLFKLITLTLLATMLITQVTSDILTSQHLIYFTALALFIVTAHSIIKYENTKGEN